MKTINFITCGINTYEKCREGVAPLHFLYFSRNFFNISMAFSFFASSSRDFS